MKFYETSIKAMEKVLKDTKEDFYADYISECIQKWESSKDTTYFIKGFSKKGRFENFTFQNTAFPSEESRYWTQQYFGGLVAMAMQLAKFINEGKTIDIDFIKKNFGHQAEVISGSVCSSCGTKQFSMADIDKCVTIPVISGGIIEGLEKEDLTDITEQIMNCTYGRLVKEREQAKERAANTNVSVSSSRTAMTVCTKCGGKNISKCRFLKSLKKNAFVALSR